MSVTGKPSGTCQICARAYSHREWIPASAVREGIADEIRQPHEKLDHLLSHQWERLAGIQEIQLEVLSELGRKG